MAKTLSKSCSSAVKITISLALILFIQFFAKISADETCYTPQRFFGLCVPATRCSWVVELMQQHGKNLPQMAKETLLKSKCTTEEPLICCKALHIIEEETTSVNPVELQPNAAGMQLLKQTECGKSSDDRVAFGQEAAVGEFPWMALLRYDSEEQPFQCGGTLITNRHVLTAAHCVANKELVSVRLGELDLDSELDCKTQRRSMRKCAGPIENVNISSAVVHENYNSESRQHDLAIITLDRTIDFKEHIQPVCLPITQVSQVNPSLYTVAGWGFTENNTASSKLQKAHLQHQDLSVCQRIFGNSEISEYQLCVGGNETTRSDSCAGDSGGPLTAFVEYDVHARVVQYGVVSIGVPQCGSNTTYPAIYVNLLRYLAWITHNIV